MNYEIGNVTQSQHIATIDQVSDVARSAFHFVYEVNDFPILYVHVIDMGAKLMFDPAKKLRGGKFVIANHLHL